MKTIFAAILATAIASPVFAGEAVTYSSGDMMLEGYQAKADNPKGTVVVIHDWDGLTQYEMDRVDMLAAMGYNAFAADLYGKGNRPQSIEENKAETGKLYQNREKMRSLILAAIDQSKSLGSDSIVLMGYCFGGAAVLELARSGKGEPAGVKAYATFHGGLSTPEGQSYSSDTAPILVAHGGADTSITMDDVAQLGKELEAAGITYEIEVYSGAPHAFTVIGSDRYQERADKKSWAAFGELLETTFN